MDKSYTERDDTSEEWVVISANSSPEKPSTEESRFSATDGQTSTEPIDSSTLDCSKDLKFDESEEKTVEKSIEVKKEAEEVKGSNDVEEEDISEESENEKQIPDSTNNSSDIDIIDEEDNLSEDEMSTASLCSSSVVSQMSNLSFFRDQYLHLLNPEFNTEDLSETSSLNYRELSQEVELNSGPRAYVHTPNTGLNGKLNLILVLSVFTVIGLGIGNYIGWSNHWNRNRQLSMGQVIKLKQLQDELVVCMQNQDIKSPQTDGHKSQVCYLDNDLWRQKFQQLFSENKGLLDLFEKTQKQYHSKGNLENVIEDKDCDNKSASDEFHNLKLGLLVNQMEHLKLLKTLEEIQHKGRQSEKRVQVLEVENQELKMKLVEEEEDDEVIVQSWDQKVKALENENKELQKRLEDDEEEDLLQMKLLNERIDELLFENNELKSAIAQLEAQVVMGSPNRITVSETGDHFSKGDRREANEQSVPIKLSLLKQRINQMVIENDELKSTIARLRWANHQSQTQSDPLEGENSDEEVEDDVTTEDIIDDEANNMIEDQLNELKQLLSSEQTESKMWKEMYETLRKEIQEKSDKNYKEEEESPKNKKPNNDYFDENIVYDWVLNSTNVLREALVKGSGVVGDKLKTIFNKIAENESIFSGDIFRGLNATQSVLFDLNRQLQNKWQDLQDLKTVFANGNQKISNKMSKLLDRTIRKLQEASNKLLSKEEDINQRVETFSNHISKLITNLDKKWNNLLNKLSDRYSKQSNKESADEDYQHFETNEPKINWFFERAKSRKEQQKSSTTSSETHNDDNHKSSYEYNRIVIEESDDDQFNSDSGVDGEPEEENWFLRKAKKPKVDDDYEFEGQSHRYRRNKFKSHKQFAHRFEYNSRQR